MEPIGRIDLCVARIMKKQHKDHKFCFAVQATDPQSANSPFPTPLAFGGGPLSPDSSSLQLQSPPPPSSHVGPGGRRGSIIKQAAIMEEPLEYMLSLPSDRELQSWMKITKRYIEESQTRYMDEQMQIAGRTRSSSC